MNNPTKPNPELVGQLVKGGIVLVLVIAGGVAIQRVLAGVTAIAETQARATEAESQAQIVQANPQASREIECRNYAEGVAAKFKLPGRARRQGDKAFASCMAA